MHLRRLASFLIGAWLGCGLFMALVATHNFRGVDQLLEHPSAPAAKIVTAIGQDSARMLLRYQVSELNRWYFETWDSAQLALGVLLLFLLLFGTTENKYTLLLAALMLVIVAFDRFVLTPQIAAEGRALDFSHNPHAPGHARFWVLHGAYSGLELIKWLLAVLLLMRMLLRHSGNARQKVNVIDKANHCHVDR